MERREKGEVLEEKMRTKDTNNVELAENEKKKLNEVMSTYSSPVSTIPEHIKKRYVPSVPERS